MKILVTGAAGFIGFHVAKSLLANGHEVYGIDNINAYYDVNLKYARLTQLGIKKDEAYIDLKICKSETFDNFYFERMGLENKEELIKIFQNKNFDVVCNLAAQAGVRYSIENPDVYISSNIVGFHNVLECAKNSKVKHFVYASSSSVYGLNKKIPFSIEDQTDTPISLYAATKKSNELIAHSYSHLYKFPTTGLRFFTVYGPWGRPDMAPFLFANAIANDKAIKVFNQGKMKRDFTYIDDITNGTIKVIESNVSERITNSSFYKLFNIGNNDSILLNNFIAEIELNLGKKAKKEFLPMQPGDVENTCADIATLIKTYNYRPKTSIKEGVYSYIKWFKTYYNKNNDAK
tara:strand:- start:8155 stop:9195 length:1041 start_codon:yes stop_codon:yes gene_type:complete